MPIDPLDASTVNDADSQIHKFDFTELVSYSIRRAYLVARTRFDNEVEKFGVGRAEFAVLSVLNGKLGINIKQLAEALAIAPSNLARMLDRLETRGLVRRQRSADDRRIQFIELTQEGSGLRLLLAKAVLDADAAMTRRLSSEECDQLKVLLQKIFSG